MAIQIKKNDLAGFVTKQVRRDFNDFVRWAQTELSKPEGTGKVYSPILTGFFSSSWRVDNKRIQPTDDIKAFAPWTAIKIKTGSKPAVLAPGNKAVVQKRFPMNTRLKTDITYYIGNSAKYASYALWSPKNKLPSFIQGEMREKVNQFFKEKKTSVLSRAGSKGYQYGTEGADIEVETDNEYLMDFGGDL